MVDLEDKLTQFYSKKEYVESIYQRKNILLIFIYTEQYDEKLLNQLIKLNAKIKNNIGDDIKINYIPTHIKEKILKPRDKSLFTRSK